MARKLARRFPASVLIEYVLDGRTYEDGRPLGSRTIAAELGVKPSTVRSWKCNDTYLSIEQADKYAVQIGEHPSFIWSDYWDWKADYCDTEVA